MRTELSHFVTFTAAFFLAVFSFAAPAILASGGPDAAIVAAVWLLGGLLTAAFVPKAKEALEL